MIAYVLAAVFASAIPGQSHTDCLKAVSLILERSGESASDVASATVEACVAAEMRPQPGSLAASMSPDDQIKLLNMQRELSAGQVRLRVVRLRACRKTIGCEIESVP